MRAAIKTCPSKIEVRDIPRPQQDGKSIITKVLRAGICGTDISLWKSQSNRYDSLAFGHEFCLEVEDPGPSPYKIGDRIIANPTGGCLFCDMCKKGFYAHCLNRKPDGEPYADAPGVRTQGAYAEYLKIRPELTYRVPDSMSSDVATLMEPLSFAFNCVNHLTERDGVLGKRILVTGGGIIAMMMCEALRSRGAQYIALTEINPARGRHALESGAANELFDPYNAEDMAKLEKLSASGFDAGFECSGIGASLDLLCKLTRRRGTIIQAGISFTPITFTNAAPVLKEITIICVYGSPGRTMEMALELAGRINYQLEDHITYPNITLEGTQKAFEDLSSGKTNAVKFVIDPHKR